MNSSFRSSCKMKGDYQHVTLLIKATEPANS